MGLLDALYAGVGQGASSGMATYTKTSQELAEEQRKRQAFEMQKQAHEREQGKDQVGLLQTLMQHDLAMGRNGLAATRVPDLRQAYGLALGHPVTMPDVVGSPVGGTPAVPAQTFAPQGPTPTGDALAQVTTAGTPAVAPHNDFSGAQTANTLASYAGYTPPTPKVETAAPGSLLYHYDTKSQKVVQDGLVPNKPGANLVRTPAGLYDVSTGQLVGGTGPAPKAGPGMQHVAVPQADGTVKYYVFNPQGGTYSEAPAVLGGKPPTAAAGKTNTLLLQHVQDLAQKYGGKITSSGERAVGSPSDTAATLVGGHQTQWGLWNAAAKAYPDQAVRRKYVAYPGTSAHGDGSAVDVYIPAPSRRAFMEEATGRGIQGYNETDSALGDHFHMTAGGALVPFKSPKAARLTTTNNGDGTSTVVEMKPGEVIRNKPTAPKPFDVAKADKAIRATLGIRAGRTVPERFKEQYDAEMAKAKAEHAAAQRAATGEKSKLQQLLEAP